MVNVSSLEIPVLKFAASQPLRESDTYCQEMKMLSKTINKAEHFAYMLIIINTAPHLCFPLDLRYTVPLTAPQTHPVLTDWAAQSRLWLVKEVTGIFG